MAQQQSAKCPRCSNKLPARRYTIDGQRVCRTCRKHHETPVARCPNCKRVRPLSDYIDGARVCATCADKHRRAVPNGTCRQCGELTYVTRGLCGAHYKRYQVAARSVGVCMDCGERKTLDTRRRCTHCARERSDAEALWGQLMQLLGPREQPSAALEQIYAHLTAHRSLYRVRKWLRSMAAPVRAALAAIGRGDVPTWTDLQPLRRLRGGEQLVSTCLRAALVQPPQADTARIDRLLATMTREGPALAALTVMQFWRFYQRERVALRQTRKLVDRTLESDRATLKIAFGFLQHALKRKGALASVTNGDLTKWIKQARPSHVPRLKPFLRWLFEAGLIKYRLHLQIKKGKITPGTGSPDAIYHAIQRRARTDDTLPLVVRVALVLITMCARYPREIVQLRLTDLRRKGRDVVWIRFGHGIPQPLEGPDAQLIKDLWRQRQHDGSPWLFPSKPRPETHMTAQGLCGWIREAGVAVKLNQLRNAACRDLLRDFAPMELCDILGMGPHVAEHWRHRGFGLTRAQKDYANKLSRAATARSVQRADA